MMSFGPLSLALTLFLLSIARSAEPTYPPAAIDRLISSGSAREHAARFANQGLGCETFLWVESDRHHVFVFRRNGVSYGEFRDVVRLEGGSLSITEQYLVADAREKDVLLKAKVLRFVRKHELQIWKGEELTGSTIQWSFLTTALDGSNMKREAMVEQRMVCGVISVVFPERWTPNGETFEVWLERKSLTAHEIAFGSVTPVRWMSELSNRRCSIWAMWPQDDPECVVTLDKRLPKDPDDPLPWFRTKRVASMGIRLDPPANVPFVFEPSPDSPRSINAR